jgi:hypothetical protein
MVATVYVAGAGASRTWMRCSVAAAGLTVASFSS